MKRSVYFPLFIVGVALLAVAVGCSNRPEEVANPTSTLIAQVKPGIVSTSEQSTTSPQNPSRPGLTPTPNVSGRPVTSPTAIITPTPTLCPPPPGWAVYMVRPGDTLFRIAQPYGLTAEEIQKANCLPSADTIQAGQRIYVPYLFPTAIPAPISVQPRTQPEKPSLKEEAFYNPGGAKDEPICKDAQLGVARQITISDRKKDFFQLCVYGFSMGEQVTAELVAPDGHHYVSPTSFTVIEESNGSTVVRILLWMPVGLPTGSWSASARSASAQLNNQSLMIGPLTQPTINTMPIGEINPFVSHQCGPYAPGESVIVQGTQFAPNQKLPLAIYWRTVPYQFDPQGKYLLKLVDSQFVSTDSQGSFTTTVGGENRAADKKDDYLVALVVDTANATYKLTDSNIDCFNVP